MDFTPAQVSELIRKRRSIFPKSYNGKPISREIIEEILENANWAPTHKLTEPWRFRVIVGNGLERLSEFLSSHYKENIPGEKFSEVMYNKLKNNPMKAACIIAICMKRDPEERLPEWEELAAVACSVQNMYLTCTAYGIGCFWSTPGPALEAGSFLGLGPGERCLGLFYMGYHDMPDLPGKRTPVSEKQPGSLNDPLMTATGTMLSATFPLIDPKTFSSQAFSWLENFKVACYLDQNEYRGLGLPAFDVLIAAGVHAECRLDRETGAFDRLKEFARAQNDWMFGYLTYDLKNDIEQLDSRNFDGIGFPALHFFRPQFVIQIKDDQVTIRSRSEAPVRVYQAILNIPVPAYHTGHRAVPLANRPLSRIPRHDYLTTVEEIRQHIRRGDIYEMNFCQEFYLEDRLIDPPSVFQRLNDISKAPFSAYYHLNDRFLLCASPERFLKKTGQQLISQPIKGTIRRGRTPREMQQLRKELYHSAKDRSENVMIVDLVRNDLSRACLAGSVHVDELFGVYDFEQVHHLISTISGTLKPDLDPIEAIRLAFPMGSMTGAPKVRSMELIEQFERTKRGLYSGAVGYFTPDGDFDFNVVIRSILYNLADRYLSIQVGGAIVFDSIPENEYEECLLKARGMFSVLERI